ncbi:HtaA domain-containing protein [Streptomyces sp. NPDC057287]|uniref:HtaA domain-containing protein n=1 Tax=Streptomyces sp. NPDC057287 TaxID=3346086 RepID=UPI00362D71C4
MAANRPIALAAAVATAAALGATFALPALAADSAAPAAAPAATVELTDGTLDWGFKESFRRYIGGAGTITVEDGATQAAGNGVFTFGNGTGTYDTTTHGTDTAFDGSVNFNAHGGALDITLSDVKVSTSGTAGAVTVDLKTPQGTQDDVAFAELDLSAVRPGQGEGGAMVFKDIPSKLTKTGSAAFNGMYAEGEVLDPATLSVKSVTTPPTEEPTKEPTKEPTQEPTEEPTKEPTKEPTGKPTATPTGKPTTPASPNPSVSATTPAAEQGEVVDGTLDWGVKESFRSYVTGPVANGKVETTGGATASAAGYRFPDATGSFDAEEQTLEAEFDGTVRFLGHKEGDAYTLDLSLTGLEVQVKDGAGTLVADVTSKDRATRKVTTRTGLAVADLKLPSGELAAKGGVVTLSAVPATLTADGTEAFGGMYAKGTPLDALTVSVALDENAELPGGSGGSGSTGGSGGTGGSGTMSGGTVGGGTVGGSSSLASTGSGLPAGALIAASGVVVAAGAGVVIAARRRRTV